MWSSSVDYQLAGVASRVQLDQRTPALDEALTSAVLTPTSATGPQQMAVDQVFATYNQKPLEDPLGAVLI